MPQEVLHSICPLFARNYFFFFVGSITSLCAEYKMISVLSFYNYGFIIDVVFYQKYDLMFHPSETRISSSF